MDAKCDLSRITIDIEYLYDADSPNKSTLAAIKKVEKNKDLVEAENAEDLFKKLGI